MLRLGIAIGVLFAAAAIDLGHAGYAAAYGGITGIVLGWSVAKVRKGRG